jgi:hypothetical protein
MGDQVLLAIMAAIALVFEVVAIQRLAPVIWSPPDTQVVSLCTGYDPNIGCTPSEPLPSWAKSP